MEEIKIKYFPGATKIEKIEQGDWIDLRSAEDINLIPGQATLIHLGVAMQLPKGYEAHIAPRSSTFKKWGIMQTNSIGIIDESYCGDNDEWLLPIIATKKATINAGDRICQFRIVKKQPEILFTQVDSLGNKDRGGFGSTGSN